MSTKYLRRYNTRKTPQSEAIPGKTMAQNNAGGYTFPVDCWTQLERFLILGSEGGSYYVGERELTIENAQNVLACIQADGLRTVHTIVGVSDAGRAPKNDPALFALALCTSPQFADSATRKYAFEMLPKVARIGTHLLHFANYMEGFRGWGRAARKGVGAWFLQQDVDRLGYQFLKYAQRDGWAMRDLLRLAHPQAQDERQNAMFRYIAQGEVLDGIPPQVAVVHGLNEETPVSEVVKTIVDYGLPREAIPNCFLSSPEVWEALLGPMPMTAMIRNLGKMTQVGLIAPMSQAAQLVTARLGDEEALRKARIHPLNVLVALRTYGQGAGFRGKLSWEVVPQVVDALDEAFYKSFQFVEPTNKRHLIGLDVSGSMTWGSVNGIPGINPRVASAALCMTVARTEPNWHIMGFSHELVEVPISPRQRLDDVVRTVEGVRMGSTDCSLPMQWALARKVPVDAFIIYTDNETWFGGIHPIQALQEYRDKMGIPAKLIVNAMTSTRFSIADPSDSGMLDVVGLDSAAPVVMADFVRS